MRNDGRRRRLPAPDELDPSSFFGSLASSDTRRAERKEKQLCRQVLEALSYTLPSVGDRILRECWIVEVEPAPDASRLCAVVGAPAGLKADEVLERLEKLAGFFRAEVAQAISRKRTPTLTFRVEIDDDVDPHHEDAVEESEP